MEKAIFGVGEEYEHEIHGLARILAVSPNVDEQRKEFVYYVELTESEETTYASFPESQLKILFGQ